MRQKSRESCRSVHVTLSQLLKSEIMEGVPHRTPQKHLNDLELLGNCACFLEIINGV